jgi:hypothetical protein
MRLNESDRKNLEQFAVVFANFAICRASFPKSKERTRAPVRFPVLKGPAGKQCAKAGWSFLIV